MMMMWSIDPVARVETAGAPTALGLVLVGVAAFDERALAAVTTPSRTIASSAPTDRIRVKGSSPLETRAHHTFRLGPALLAPEAQIP